ncbi:MAG: PDZ domain-containing protein [Candidatus Bathyarchaeia archaeon]
MRDDVLYVFPISGALCLRVVPDSPVEQAEVTNGDVIIEVGGVEIRTMEELQKEISRRRVGEAVRIIIIRNGRRWSASVALGRTP